MYRTSKLCKKYPRKCTIIFRGWKCTTQWLECKDESLVAQPLTDDKIVACVLNSKDANLRPDTESDEEEINISHEKGLH